MSDNLKVWKEDDFEVEFGLNFAEDAEAVTNESTYYTLADGRKVEVVTVSGIVKINKQVVGRIEFIS